MLVLLQNWKLVAGVVCIVIGLLGAGGAVIYEHHEGYEEGFKVAHQQCEDDKAKMETANENAINAAAKALASAQQQIDQKDAQLDDYEKALDLAANQDPGAAQCGIGADSVRRLSAIQ